jgi:glutamyl-tRNA reductase
MEITAWGLNHRTAPVEVREKIALAPPEMEKVIRTGVAGDALCEALVLSTCNRTELFGVGPDARAAAEAIREAAREVRPALSSLDPSLFYEGTNRAAVRHLARVAAGLDSQVLGENEIIGQVREAFDISRTAGGAGPVLDKLRAAVLHAGGRIRSETALCRGAVSLSSAAVDLARKVFTHLKNKKALIIGAGEMAGLAGRCLMGSAAGSIVVANRTPERGQKLAASLGAESSDLAGMRKILPAVDLIISAVGGGECVLRRSDLEAAVALRGPIPMLLIDIAMPRSLDPEIRKMETVYLKTLDDLNSIIRYNTEARKKEVSPAERIVDEEVEKYMAWLDVCFSDALLGQLAEKLERIRCDEVRRTLRKKGPLEEKDLEKLTRSLIDKILYYPSAAMKKPALCAEDLEKRIQALRDLFGLNGRP